MISRRHLLYLGVGGGLSAAATPLIAQAVDSTVKHDVNAKSLARRIHAATAALDVDKLLQLAIELCETPNPLGHEERIAQLFHSKLQKEGLTSRLQPFAPNRSNVLGTSEGTGGGSSLMFVGHLESGPSPQGVKGQYPKPRITSDGWMEGVGIWNMKGALACYLAAVSAIRKSGTALGGDVLIAGVAGTHDQTVVDSRIKGDGIQGYSIGTMHLLAQGTVADMALVGEPTSFKLVRQHFGTTAVRIDISVARSRPIVTDDMTQFVWPEVDAVEFAAEAIQRLREWIPNYKDRSTVDGIRPWVFISGVEGGAPWSPYPAVESSIFVFAGTPPHTPAPAVLNEIRSTLAPLGEKYQNLKIHADVYFRVPGPFVSQDNPIVTKLQASHANIFGKQPDVTAVPWHSDASPLTRFGIPAVNYGPSGRIETASDSGSRIEAVRVEDLVRCARVYTDLIVRVCSEKRP